MTQNEVNEVLKAVNIRLQKTWFTSEIKDMIGTWLRGTSRKEILKIISDSSNR